MREVIEIGAESFEKEVLKADIPVVVEFFSHSCPHCRKFKPIYSLLSDAIDGKAKFYEIDVLSNDENRNLALKRGVHGVPTVEVFYHGRNIGNVIGYHPLNKMVEAVGLFLENKDKHVGPSTSIHELKEE